ncbi:MAG: tripartite tricarboxylate transporter substrate binding protein, partial [Burkholderiaceae bacterium]
NKAYTDALAHPDVKTRFATLMADPVATTPEQFGALMTQERAKYGPVVKASGARLD